jgi:spore maturation protein CgeB
LKILFLGNFGRHNTDIFRVESFRALDWKVFTYEYRQIAKWIAREELAKENTREARKKVRARINDMFLELMEAHEPDIAFLNKIEMIDPPTLKKAKAAFPNCTMLMFYGDQRGKAETWVADRAREVDALLLTNNDVRQKKQYEDFGVKKIVPHYLATEPSVFRPIPMEEVPEIYHCDIAFFGHNYYKMGRERGTFPFSKMRFELIDALSKEFSVKVYGREWPQDRDYKVMHERHGWAFPTAASGAKILLGINAYHDINRYTSNRFWNCIAVGFHLTYYFTGLQTWFSSGYELAVFHSIPEALQEAEQWLKKNDLRESVRGNGRRKLIDDGHTYEHRTQELLKIVEEVS